MAGNTSPSKALWRVILFCHFAQITLGEKRFSNEFAQTNVARLCVGDKTFRTPDNSDMNVTCGSHTVYLSMLLCPIYFNGYNETLMFLNSQHQNPTCQGEADWDAKPPVLRFNFSITMEGISECASVLKVENETGTGAFSQFSMVQFINISGRVSSKDPSNGAITYFQEAMYMFSCRYSLQYLISNTKMNVSGVTLAVKDTNGSFLSTLDMQLYADQTYEDFLGMPIYLKTRVFVQVRASNLTDRFYVLLDRCYATALPIFVENSHFDLFVGCNRDGQTLMDVNGQMQVARFSFEAFRFTQATNLSVSTYYVHCATRLCVKDICPSLIEDCSARKRRSAGDPDSVSDVATVTSGPITINIDNGYLLTGDGFGKEGKTTVVAVSAIAGIIGAICLTLVAFIVYNKYYAKKVPELGKTTMYAQD